jgi:glycosyltransferase involved in cell wall biosynthesis
MPRTVLLLHSGGSGGIRGTEACLVQSAKAFSAAGFRVVLCRKRPVVDRLLAQLEPAPWLLDLDFPELMIGGGETSLPLRAYAQSFRRLGEIVREIRPDLIYCSGGLPCQLAVPVGKLQRVPVLCHFHHPAIRRAYYLWLVKFADAVIFSSQFTREHSDQRAGLSGDVVYNGVNLESFAPVRRRDTAWRVDLGIHRDAAVIGQVSQLIPTKRPDFLMRAFVALLDEFDQPLHLCLVGKGPMQDSLRDLARELGISSHVTITGYVPDVTPYYQHVFDINVLASREEGLGIASLEGAACGLPVVVTRCTGLSETIIENETGLAFELEDMADLRAKLALLISDPRRRATMGRAGRNLVQRRFSAQSYDEGVVSAARKLLAAGTHPYA